MASLRKSVRAAEAYYRRNWRTSLADSEPLLYPAFILAVVVFVAWLMMAFR
jgi:hypothetical protein